MSSIREVADKAGVSPATVSRTFTTPELLNEKTQKRVLEVAREMGYRPRSLRPPRAAAGKKPVPAGTAVTAVTARDSGAIGFQFFAASPRDTLAANTFYAPMLAGAQAEASALGLHLLVHTTDRHSMAVEMPRMVREQAVGGMLLVGTAEPAVLDAFADFVPHLLLVDNRDAARRFESVVSDGFGGARAATRHLFDLGHRRIAFFLAEPHVATFQDRLRGFLCAHWDAGLPAPDPARIISGAATKEQTAALHGLLDAPAGSRPTALVAANDHYAVMALRICREAGLRAPADISVVGFDDTPFSQETDPPLTTVRVDKELLGRLAVRQLHLRLRNDPPGARAAAGVCHELPVSLVMRGSCRAL